MTTDAQQPTVVNVHDEGHIACVGGDSLSWAVVADEETDLVHLHVQDSGGKVQTTQLTTSSDLLPLVAAVAKANGLKLTPDTLLRSGRWKVDAFDGSWSIWDRLNGTFVPGHAHGDRADAEAAVDRFYAEGKT